MLENWVRLVITDKNLKAMNRETIMKWRAENPNGKVVAYLKKRPQFNTVMFYVDRMWADGKLVKDRGGEVDDTIRFLDDTNA